MTNSNSILLTAVMVLAAACDKSAPPTPSTSRTEVASAATSSTQPQPAAAPTAVSTAQPAAGSLTLVTDRSLVCMVNNQFMGRPQIPIEVGGRTYYGCCEMCKGRLGNDPSSRTGVDPVSQRPVDKAIAVIGRAENGATFYFENEQNFAAYSRQARAN